MVPRCERDQGGDSSGGEDGGVGWEGNDISFPSLLIESLMFRVRERKRAGGVWVTPPTVRERYLHPGRLERLVADTLVVA